ncbi:hypothetical protein IMY05_C4566000300 [Salix suchowensis]|nr:hypothetical protein IMY05_C4566000300 [Salix suchowensis]
MDYSRPAPPQGNWDLARGAPPEQRLTKPIYCRPPPTYAFVTRYYKQHPQLSSFSIALGALYMSVCVIEIIGVVGSAMVCWQGILFEGFALTRVILAKLALVRIYALASVLAFVIVLAAGIMRIVIHFQFKSSLPCSPRSRSLITDKYLTHRVRQTLPVPRQAKSALPATLRTTTPVQCLCRSQPRLLSTPQQYPPPPGPPHNTVMKPSCRRMMASPWLRCGRQR